MIRALTRPLAQPISRRVTEIRGPFTPPIAVPGAPTGVSATAGNAQATVSFTAPASSGGGPITGYRVTASTGQTATGASSPITVTGLTNGTPVTFTVQAQNAGGYGPASTASASVTPTAAILTNGDFATSTGWTPSGTSLSVANNRCEINFGTGSVGDSLAKTIAGVAAGDALKITFDAGSDLNPGNGSVRFGIAADGVATSWAPDNYNSWGGTAARFVTVPEGLTNARLVIERASGSAGVAWIDNITIAQATLGSELVTNGDFTSSTGWSITGTSTISGGVLNAQNLNNTTDFVSRPANGSLVNGGYYVVAATITSIASGALSVKVGGGNFNGGHSTVARRAWIVQASSGANIVVQGQFFSPAFTGTVDDVSVRQVT